MPMIRSRSVNTLWLSWLLVGVVVSTIVVSVVENVWPDIPGWIDETVGLGVLGAVEIGGVRSGRSVGGLRFVWGLSAFAAIEVLAAVLLDEVALLWMALMTAVIAMGMFWLMRAMRSAGTQEE